MSEKNKKKKYPGVSAIFWTVFALILLILFLVNKNRIFSVLQTTGFFSKVFGTEPEFIQNHPSDDTNKPIAELESSQETTENEPTIVVLNAVSGQATVSSGQPAVSSETSVTAPSVTQNQTQIASASTVTTNTTQNASASNSSAAASANNSNTSTSSRSAGKTAATVPETPAPAASSQMKQHLFFIQIDNDGSVLRKESVRTITKTNTPLTAAITALLDGPNIDEIEKG